jgi:hypothetical protein
MTRHRLTALLALVVLALAVTAGSALAGGDHGKGGTNGNSANAPGQLKQQSAAQPAAAQPAAAPTAKTKHESKQSSTSASAPATGGDNSTGVKPSNTTKHDTFALASSNQTKSYGNGKTAGQIATAAGFGGATLHGPGNSQPHKMLCGGHEVDVHALAHKGSKCGTAPAAVKPAAVTPTVVTPSVVTPSAAAVATTTVVTVTTPVVAAPAPAVQAAKVTKPAPAAKPVAAGSVKGAHATLKPAKAKAAGSVLGKTTRLGSPAGSSTLPFTGLPLWIFALVAAGLLGIGLATRHAAGNRNI